MASQAFYSPGSTQGHRVHGIPIGPNRVTGLVVSAGPHKLLMNPGFCRILPLAEGPQVGRGKSLMGPLICPTAQRVFGVGYCLELTMATLEALMR